MKKLLSIIVLGLLWFNSALAEKDLSNYSLNENINNYGWKIKSTKFFSGENPKEIYTLTKDKILMFMFYGILVYIINIIFWIIK